MRCEELLGAEPFLLDQGSGLKAAREDLGGVVEHRLARLRATEGGGGAHTHQLLTGALEAIAQAADQAGQIGSLSAIEGVELVDDEITKNPCVVVLPEALHVGLDQQVVELLVVGEQDVRWCLVQGVLVGDHACGGHRRGRRVVGRTDVETGAQPGKGRNGVDQIGDAPRLVGGQGIHRVNEDRLDPSGALGVLLAAVLQQRQEKALRFAGSGASSHQGVAWSTGQKPIKGLLLVEVRREGEGDLGEPIAPRALAKGQSHRHIRALEQLLAIGQETVDQARKARCGGVKSGANGVGSDLLQFAGNNGREQDLPQICTLTLGEISVLATDPASMQPVH